MTQQEKQEAVEMYDAGFSPSAIAKKLNTPVHKIKYAVNLHLNKRIKEFKDSTNPMPVYDNKCDTDSRAYFFPEQRGNDGIEGYLCGEIMKSRKKLNELYDTHSKLRYGNNPAKEVLLKLANEQITDLEKQLGL